MNSFNPFNTLMNRQMNSAPKQNTINPQQFKQMVPQARNQGISDQDIQQGLNYIQSLK